MILEDDYNLRKIQLKTVAKTADTPAWEIHRSILRPLACNCEELGFDYPTAVGVEGGVVLIDFEVDTNQKINVSYFFTEVYVINAIALKFINRHGNTVNAAKNLRETIRKGEPSEKISVARGMFVPAAGPQNLLRLIGMHSSIPHGGWHFLVREMSRLEWGPKTESDMGNNPLTQRNAEFRKELPSVMKAVCGCDPQNLAKTCEGGEAP